MPVYPPTGSGLPKQILWGWDRFSSWHGTKMVGLGSWTLQISVLIPAHSVCPYNCFLFTCFCFPEWQIAVHPCLCYTWARGLDLLVPIKQIVILQLKGITLHNSYAWLQCLGWDGTQRSPLLIIITKNYVVPQHITQNIAVMHCRPSAVFVMTQTAIQSAENLLLFNFL